VKIFNKEMIIWVAELSAKAVGKENVFIATDDPRISQVVLNYDFKFIMTNSDLLTGTDRVAAASKELNYDIFVNVQGDEPIVNPSDILRAIDYKKKFPDSIINSYCYLKNDEDPSNKNIPKVITNENDDLIYISRAVIPNSKKDCFEGVRYKKQVCIYSYSKKDLDNFLSYGKKSFIEGIEDIEILRFFEFGTNIKMFETSFNSQAVDVISDVAKVEFILKNEQSKK
jgi:3-deoxy-manno-octulosonate cytidylyltransferase (CMP-KDO synthetase)